MFEEKNLQPVHPFFGDIKAMSKLCSKIVVPGANPHIFCSEFQFRSEYKIHCKEAAVQNDTSWSDSDIYQE